MPRRRNDQQEYLVEKVMGKRIQNGKTEYYIKWENYHQNFNTWEPLQNLLSCIQIIAEYENQQEKFDDSKKHRDEDQFQRQQILQKLDTNQGHFLKGDVPEKIRTVRENNKQIFLTVIWKERSDGFLPDETIINSKEMRQFDPDFLIQFYESKMKFVEKALKMKQQQMNQSERKELSQSKQKEIQYEIKEMSQQKQISQPKSQPRQIEMSQPRQIEMSQSKFQEKSQPRQIEQTISQPKQIDVVNTKSQSKQIQELDNQMEIEEHFESNNTIKNDYQRKDDEITE